MNTHTMHVTFLMKGLLASEGLLELEVTGCD